MSFYPFAASARRARRLRCAGAELSGLALAEPIRSAICRSPATPSFCRQRAGPVRPGRAGCRAGGIQNSADGLNAVVAGKLDVGAWLTAGGAYFKGANLKIIGGIMGWQQQSITTPENASKYNTARCAAKKSPLCAWPRGRRAARRTQDAGIRWKTDVQIFELKNPPAVIEAVKSGQVDAGVVWGPRPTCAPGRPGPESVIHSTDLQPGHPCWAGGHRHPAEGSATWEKFCAPFSRREKFATENKQQTIDSIAKYVKLDPKLLWRGFTPRIWTNPATPTSRASNTLPT